VKKFGRKRQDGIAGQKKAWKAERWDAFLSSPARSDSQGGNKKQRADVVAVENARGLF
jgi:hypothetical protein